MKKLLLVRHAKSSWDNTTLNDFERPLNDRGKKDAPVMAQRLLEKKIAIDAFISSPARRALTTAEFFAAQYKRDKKEIIQIEELYASLAESFFEVISKVSDDYSTIAVFSHNPGITEFASMLTNARIDEMPTCGIFAVTINTGNWSAFESSSKEFWFFDYPKSGG